MKRLVLLSAILVGLAISQNGVTQSALAIPYNYELIGDTYTITGMFDCTHTFITDCDDINLTSWMFTASNTPTFGDVTISSADPGSLFGGSILDFEAQNSFFGIGLDNDGPPLFRGIIFVEQLRAIPERIDRTVIQSRPTITAKTTSPVPEPTTMMLFGTGLLGLAGYRWHQRRREGTQLG